MALDRQTLRYRSRRHDDEALRTRIREIAETKRRYGCPRIYIRLRREGWRVNHKRVERLYYRDEGLSLRRRRRRKLAAVPRIALPRPTQPGRCYALDFVHDRLATGRRYKCLTMTDPCSKEVPVIEVDVSIGGARVCRILDRLFLSRPLPETLIMDNVLYAERKQAVRTVLPYAVRTATLHESANTPNDLPRHVRRCSP